MIRIGRVRSIQAIKQAQPLAAEQQTRRVLR
jgi:hypothetical protein